MADSVDRVFNHALNTVTKIRAGSEKPPSHIRLNLYGLYKQSMVVYGLSPLHTEGDVSGIMNRPIGDSEEIYRAQEKWDAWKQQNGLSRTEAKRRYINKLIETMRQYASRSPDARELVAELEFVWDQVKSNISSNASSHPTAVLANDIGRSNASLTYQVAGNREQRINDQENIASAMRTLAPSSAVDRTKEHKEEDEEDGSNDADDMQDDYRNMEIEDFRNSPQSNQNLDKLWQRTVEQAIVRMTTEVAALREQPESRSRFFKYNPPKRIISLLLGFFWGTVKHIAIDFILLTIVLLWLRKRRIGRKETIGYVADDSRVEAAFRVLIGDAVAQVKNIG